MPVFQYGNVYLGLMSILDEKTDLVHCQLAYSVDTINWHHIGRGTDFIPLGQKASYDCGCIYAAATPIILDNEIRIYYAGSNAPHTTWRNGFLCLGTLRKDGFAGYQPITDKRGTLITKGVKCTGDNLCITADVNDNGSVSISILDEKENVIDTAVDIKNNTTDGVVKWNKIKSLDNLKGKPFHLKFDLISAKLYSFAFTE